MNKKISLSVFISLLFFSANSIAQDKVSTTGGLKVSSDNFTFKVNGRLQLDATMFQSDEIDLNNGTEVRRARLAVSGAIYDWQYKLQYDFAGDGNIKDAFISYAGIDETKITVGNHTEAFGMESATSSKQITFIERSVTSDLFSLGRGMGVSALKWGDNWMANVGVFGQDVNATNAVDEEIGFNGRFNYAPLMTEESLFIIGASYSNRKPDNESETRFGVRPSSHKAHTRIVDVKLPVSRYELLGFESIIQLNSITILAEHIQSSSEIDELAKNVDFSSTSVSASYFLTGEKRSYSFKGGKFKNVIPKKNGAWEIGVRYSSVNLNDTIIKAGSADLLTLGVNYYFNSNVRAMVNFITADGDEYAAYDTNAISTRLQVVW